MQFKALIVGLLVLMGAALSSCKEEVYEPIGPYSQPAGLSCQIDSVQFCMVHVDGGYFYMGAQSSDASALNYDGYAELDEKPVHSVRVDGFYIAQTEVTQGLWMAIFPNDTARWTAYYGKGDNYPAYNVSFNEALQLVDSLNLRFHRTGQLPPNYRFSLPTEAQWEFAARGGNKTHHYVYAGSDSCAAVCWYGDSYGGTKKVATKLPNELGLYDMCGNVYEWCADWYAAYDSASAINPQGPLSGENCVYRGGSWFVYGPYFCRITNREWGDPTTKGTHLGFRLVLVAK